MKAKIVSIALVFAIITVSLFAVAFSSSTSADIEYGSTESEVLGNPNVVIRGTTDSDEAAVADLLDTLSFSDNVSYWYVVYPDSSTAAADGVVAGDVVSVVYDGDTYSNVVVFIGDQFDGSNGLNKKDSINSDNLNGIIGANTTIFFKPGNYNVSDGNGYYCRFYYENLSLIGLGDTTHPVTFNMGYFVESSTKYDTRNLLMSNFYVSDITFDAGNHDLRYITKSSMGQNYFHMTGCSGIVFNDVIIKNIGTSNNGSEINAKNVAINVLNSNKVVFNNLTLQNCNCKTGYAPLQVNNSSFNVYFNNLDLDDVYDTQGFVKVEDGTTVTTGLMNTSVFFTGTLNFENMADSEKTIYVQSYVYNTVAFPSDMYRYVQVKNQNGSSYSPYITVSNYIPASISGYAIFDLKDNTFIVKDGDTLTGQQQVQNIVDVIACIQKVKGTSSSEEYNIKYEVGDSIGSMNLPEIKVSTAFQSGSYDYTGYWENIQLNVIPVKDIGDDIRTKETLVFDSSSGSSITLPSSNDRYSLFNIDFDKVEGCTLQEVIAGIVPLASVSDPYEYLYGTSNGLTYSEYSSSKPALVPNATEDTFQSCVFTSLVNKIEIAGTSTWYVGDEGYLTAGFTDTNDNSFTYLSIVNDAINKDTANDGSPIVKWFSTDESIATVDMDTGKVTVVGVGTVTIVAKAADSYNEGEIEKPWATYQLVANPGVYTVTFDSNGGVAAIPLTKQVTYGSEYGTLATTTRNGYTFNGWYTSVDGGDRIYATSIFTSTSDITLYASWSADTQAIEFNANGGQGTMEDVFGKTGSHVTLTTNGFEKQGYSFIGWSTSSTSSTVSYHDGASIIMPAGGLDLYAVWEVIDYTITFNSTQVHVMINGMEAVDGETVHAGDIVVVTAYPGYQYVVSNMTGSDGTYTVDGTGDVMVESYPVYDVLVDYDSDIISISGVPTSGTVIGGDSLSVSIWATIPVKEIYVTVTMGGETIDAFQYSSWSLISGTVIIENVTGDVTITVDYDTVPIDSPSSDTMFLEGIAVVIILASFLILLLFIRRKIIFDNEYVGVTTVDGDAIAAGSRIRKGETIIIKPSIGYRYEVSNATGSDGRYTVDGHFGNVRITSVEIEGRDK